MIAAVFVVYSQMITDSPIAAAKKVTDKLIRETSFEFSFSQQTPSSTIQSIDFSEEFPRVSDAVCYAVSSISSPYDSNVTLGISHNAPLKIWVNGQLQYSNENGTEKYKEIAYDMFHFPKTVSLSLKSGENAILIKSVHSSSTNAVHFAFLNINGSFDQRLSFSVKSFFKKDSIVHRWLLIGPFTSDSTGSKPLFDNVFPPEKEIKLFYQIGKQILRWQLPRTQLEMNDVIPADASFKQHSYFEWHYANGQTTLAVSLLADATKEKHYSDFVKKYCATTLDTYDYFRHQYSVLHNTSGFNYRLFRKSMLDDSSAPTLPFVELYLKGILPESKSIIDTIAQYITYQQSRLFDGTLCRPEPEALTVWADDLFMGVPFLLRYAKMTGDKKYYDDAARQIINFNKYLFDSKSGLSAHCWYDQQQKQGAAHWGRANGWMIWAISEALTLLPTSHKDYDKVLKIFRQQIKGLSQYQNANGMWHQVLDHPESYEETSCTAMFVLAMARGVRNGWIDKKYTNNALAGWEGVKRKIAEDGTVSGICQGTGIGDDLEFYFERKTPKHDPRGLGSVITAGVEMQKLLEAQ